VEIQAGGEAVGKAKRDHEQAAPLVIGVEIHGRLPWRAVKHRNQAVTGDKIHHKQKIGRHKNEGQDLADGACL
jgi:hypothetical protein